MADITSVPQLGMAEVLRGLNFLNNNNNDNNERISRALFHVKHAQLR